MIGDESWNQLMSGYETSGYGYQDYSKDLTHGFIEGSYGTSVSKPDVLVKILTEIPDTRIFMYQERGWGNFQDVVVIGRPGWAEGFAGP